MSLELVTQEGVEASGRLAVRVPTVGANAHVCARSVCAQLLVESLPAGVWR